MVYTFSLRMLTIKIASQIKHYGQYCHLSQFISPDYTKHENVMFQQRKLKFKQQNKGAYNRLHEGAHNRKWSPSIILVEIKIIVFTVVLF